MIEYAAIEARGSHQALILINHLEEEREKALKAEIRLLIGGYDALAKLAADQAEKHRRHINRIKRAIHAG